MDYTLYQFDGESRAKSNLALAVITKYVKEKKPTNLEDIQKLFGPHAIANETRAKVLADTSGRNRHFLNAPLEVGGKKVYVSNQWKLQTIEKLIETAKGLGMKIAVSKEVGKPLGDQKKVDKPTTKPTKAVVAKPEKAVKPIEKKVVEKKPVAKAAPKVNKKPIIKARPKK